MKKLISLFLALTMVFSLAVPAVAAEDTQTIYFKNTAGWSAVYAYAWDASAAAYLGSWPGTKISLAEGETDVYSVEVSTAAINIIFNNGSDQTNDLTIPTDGNDLYSYGTGTWSTYGSAGDTSNQTEGDVTASYTPTITISGVTISGDSVTTEGTTYTVTIPADETQVDVTVTVSGQNLDKIPADNYNYMVTFGHLLCIIADGRYDPNTGTVVMPITLDADAIGTYDLQYTTDGINWTDNEWDVVVKQADPTYVSLNVMLKAIDSSTGAEITEPVDALLDASPVTNNVATEFNVIQTGNRTMHWYTVPAGYKTPADVSLTLTDDGNGNGELTSNSSHASVELVDGVYVITVTLETETTEPEATATITGVSLSGTGVTYDEATRTYTVAHDATDITLTVTGTNLANLTQDNVVMFAPAQVVFGSEMSPGETANTVWTTVYADWFKDSNNFEIQYSTDGTTFTGMGIYVTYDDGTAAAYDVNIVEVENGAVSADKQTAAAGETVTLTWTTEGTYELDNIVVKDADGNEVTIADRGLTAWTFTMPTSAVTVTATFKKIETTSANIAWGSLAYTYTDEAGAWSAGTDDDAGTVTVTNTGTTAITATPSYAAATDEYGTFTGSFDVASADLDAGASKTFTLSLSGDPTKAIPAGTKIGTVTITIK